MADAKVYAMIDDLSRGACIELLGYPVSAADQSHSYLISVVRQQYETGHVEDHDIVAAWEDDRGYECAECGASDHPSSECPHKPDPERP